MFFAQTCLNHMIAKGPKAMENSLAPSIFNILYVLCDMLIKKISNASSSDLPDHSAWQPLRPLRSLSLLLQLSWCWSSIGTGMPPGTLGKHPGALYFFMTSTTASFPLAKSSAFPCFFWDAGEKGSGDVCFSWNRRMRCESNVLRIQRL